MRGIVLACFRIRKDSSCALLSNNALVDPKPIAHPFFSAAFARCILISVASCEPPVIELTKKGAFNGLFKKLVCKLILLKLISGSALWIKEIPSKIGRAHV